MQIKILELVVVIIYFLAMVGIGWHYRGKQTEESFWVANRSVGAFVNGMAIFATIGSAATFMGFISVGYSLGVTASLATIAGGALGYAFAAVGFAAPLRKFGKFTLGDFLSTRYETRSLKLITAILTVVFFFAYLIPQLKGGGLVLQFLTGLPYWQGVVLGGLVFIIYVTMGGMLAITWTDFIQGVVAWCTMSILTIVIFAQFGGVGNMLQAATAADPGFAISKLPFWSVFGYVLSIALFMGASPHVVMRQFTAKTPHAGRMSVVIAMIAMDFFALIWFSALIAGGKVYFPNLADPDNLVLYVAGQYLPPLLLGLLAAGILAAVQSTTDAMLLAIGASISHDIYRGGFKPDATSEQVFKVGKIAMVLVGVAAILLTLKPPGLIGVIVGLITGGIGASFFFPLWMGIWWKRASKWGGITGVLGGFIVFLVVQFGKLAPNFMGAVIGALTSLVLIVVVSLLTSPPSDKTVEMVSSLRD